MHDGVGPQSGRVVYIGQIPNVDYDEEDILKFLEPFGKITRFFFNKIGKEVTRASFLFQTKENETWP